MEMTNRNTHLNECQTEPLRIPQATKQGYIEVPPGSLFDMSYPESKTRRGRVQEGGKVSPTLMASGEGSCLYEGKVEQQYRIRKLTPKECFRLMGVSESYIDKIQQSGVSQSQQYKMAGNSIVVDVLEHIFRKMFVDTGQESQQLSLF
jgi:DNA (cytosine-5)-methyltransferase 1